MLRTSLISWIALSAALLVLGLWLGNVVLLSGAVFVLLVALLSATLSPPAGITVQRSLPPFHLLGRGRSDHKSQTDRAPRRRSRFRARHAPK